MESGIVKIIYFFMNGCSWCEKFSPEWDIIEKKSENNSRKSSFDEEERLKYNAEDDNYDEYNEDEGIFSKAPKHNWASHPSDAFTYGCQILQEDKIKPKDEPPKFWDEQTLDQLWKSNKNLKKKRI